MPKFTRSEVRSILGDACTDEIENRLVALHLGVVDPLKDALARAQADASKLEGVQRELDGFKNGEDWKSKYEKEHTDFEAFKGKIEAEADAKKKSELYVEQVLKPAGVDERRIKSIMRLTDLSKVKVKDEKIEGAEGLISGVKTEWADFIPIDSDKHASPATPPNGQSGGNNTSRAAQIAAEYHKNLYGEKKGE